MRANFEAENVFDTYVKRNPPATVDERGTGEVVVWPHPALSSYGFNSGQFYTRSVSKGRLAGCAKSG